MVINRHNNDHHDRVTIRNFIYKFLAPPSDFPPHHLLCTFARIVEGCCWFSPYITIYIILYNILLYYFFFSWTHSVLMFSALRYFNHRCIYEGWCTNHLYSSRVQQHLVRRVPLSHAPLTLSLRAKYSTQQADTSKLKEWTKHPKLINWIEEQVRLCQPAKLHLCDGSEEEFNKYV